MKTLTAPIAFILFFQLFLCISCHQERNKRILSESESIINTDPDSALTILASIYYPEDLKKNEYNRYNLLLVRARYESHRDITSDSTILLVKDYYMKKKDTSHIAWSAYYCGCFRQAGENWEEAMKNYLIAINYADKTEESNLKGMIHNKIGLLLLRCFDNQEAIGRFRKSAFLFGKAGNTEKEAVSYIQTGNSFQYLDQPDSALHYYTAGLNLADKNDMQEVQSIARQSIALFYYLKKDTVNTIRYLKDALTYNPNQMNRMKMYNFLTEIYSCSEQLDSAYVYINQTLQRKDSIKDPCIKSSLHRQLSNIKEKEGDYVAALANHKLYSDYMLAVLNNGLDKNLQDLQRKYNYEKIRSHNIYLKLTRIYLSIYFSIALVLISCIAFFFYRRSRIEKKKELDLEWKISELQNMSRSFNEKEETFRSHLLRRFDILKKVSNLEIYIEKDSGGKSLRLLKKFNEIVYGQDSLNWDILYDTMNELHDGFFTKLRKLYPNMSETNFRIICLTYVKFSSNEIAIVMKLSANTINIKRSVIRKELGVPSFTSLNDFLDEKLK